MNTTIKNYPEDISNDMSDQNIMNVIKQYGLNDIADLNISSFKEKLISSHKMKIPPMPTLFKPFIYDFQKPQIDPEFIEKAYELKAHILYDVEHDIGAVRRIIDDNKCLKKRVKEKIIKAYDGTLDALEKLIVKLQLKLLDRYQLDIMELIEDLIIIYTLKTDESIYQEINSSGSSSIDSLFNLYENKTDMNYCYLFNKYLLNYFINKIVKDFKLNVNDLPSLQQFHDDNQSGVSCKTPVSIDEIFYNLFMELAIMEDLGNSPPKNWDLDRFYSSLFMPTKRRKEYIEFLKPIIKPSLEICYTLIPAKDISLLFRAIAGNDCSIDFDFHVTHPCSCFYKIIDGENWIGYISLLEVIDDNGIKAILFDVINIRNNPGVDSLELFNQFVNNIESLIEPEGYGYILIPDNYKYLSNYDYIRMPIYHFYCNAKKLMTKLILSPFEETFQSIGSDSYIIVRDFSDHGQLKMFNDIDL